MSGLAWVLPDGRTTTLPAGWAPLTGHRVAETYEWRLLDDRDRFVGLLDGVESGSLDGNVNADTRWTGQLTWSGDPLTQPSWRDTRVQPAYTATLGDGSTVTWPLGVFLCSSPDDAYTDGLVTCSVALFDKTLIPRRTRVRFSYTVTAGVNVIDKVRTLLNLYYGGRHTIEDSTATLRSSMTWEADTPWLTVINELLSAAGYFALAADGDGVLRSGPYVRPQDRPRVFDFTDGDVSIYDPGFTHRKDDFDVPNRVSLSSRADGDTPALRSSITLDDIAPGHPWATSTTGQIIDRVERDVEATSQAVLDAKAERLMREALQVTSDVQLTHAPVPLGLLDRVRFRRTFEHGALDLDAVVQTMSIDCTPGADWTSNVREVVG